MKVKPARSAARGTGARAAAALATFVGLATAAFAFPAAGDPRTKPVGQPVPALPNVTHNSGPPTVFIGGGERSPIPIALPRLDGVQDISDAVLDVAARDLSLSSLFQVMDAKTYSGVKLYAEGLTIDEQAWRAAGAEAVIKGKATIRGNKIHLQLRLYALPAASAAHGSAAASTMAVRPAVDREIDVLPEALRSAVHSFGNDVVHALVHETGTFGTRLVFSSTIARGEKGVFQVDSDGAGLTRVRTSSERVALEPAFNAIGDLYYTGGRTDGSFGIFRLGNPAAMLGRLGASFGVAFGPIVAGHAKMAVVVGNAGASDIYVGDATGEGPFTKVATGGLNMHPAFGPDEQLAYVSTRAGNPQIYVGQRRVTHRGAFNMAPSWCRDPEGLKVLFMGRDGSTWDIFSVAEYGGLGAVRRLTQDQGSNTYPACSPDGRTVAFFSTRGGLFSMSSRGLNQQPIATAMGESLRWEGN